MNLSFTAVDILVILLVIMSAGYAAWKGFLSETLTVFDWLAAAFGCLYVGPYLAPMTRGFIAMHWVASLVAYAVAFLAIFIPLSFLSHRFSENVKNSPIGPLDRAMGIAFGVVRGLVVVAVVYLAYTYYVPVRDQGNWIRQARTLPVIQSTSELLLSLVPSQTKGDFSIQREASPARSADPIGNLIRDNEDANRAPDRQREPAAQDDVRQKPPENKPQGSPAKKAEKGYGASDRRALDTLLQGGGNR